ncbi:glycerol-3-phosphate responsive antiterminator (mRNA-binding) [Thermobacillus composti KWC4]|jgi:glycerol uptake operon antiterminator|uniref:Glycerol uptake operon antiterminator regulatory protein n=1 Tax=Thermobacillus composti (strain DSM 18247 / JCM 13945 / KWC4) TaxID=717605 RepID=L0EHD7_THECK|nr:glycerol-3-phosphate responsive antiterminator [Thermobacillus composti]AGA59106.1 glycerol-3-phosphate responsive antiterminator (mRNA-binding) [Thermobacillus composti KWC4]
MKNQNTNMKTISYALKTKPVITSIVSDNDLEPVLRTASNIVFLLTGNIFTLKGITERVQDAGKLMFVHLDLMEGLGKDAESVRYLAEVINVDGIVTTRSNLIQFAQKCGLISIQRLFVFDSVSLDNSIRIIKSSKPDAIEVLPGIVVPRVMGKLRQEIDLPVIAGGLISDLDDLKNVLDHGAIGISTSSKELWKWQDDREKK